MSRTEAPPPSPLGLTAGELDDALGRIVRESGHEAYRVRQVLDWLWKRTPAGFSGMRNVPGSLRHRLDEAFVLHPLRLEDENTSSDGTRKYLWSRASAGAIESVLIPDGARVTYCVSSQAGCPVKCPFCATGQGGFQGQLEAAEIVDQVVSMRSVSGASPTNIVFMGMGEPLLNFDAVLRALEVLTSPRQLGFGARRITVSTVGIPDRIRELARLHPQVGIALSLHSARDDVRDVLVPMNRRYPLADVLEALRETREWTSREITFEYVVLPGVNDREEDIAAIPRRLAGLAASINLIGFNPFPGAAYRRPPVRDLLRLRERLAAVFPGSVTLRRSRGNDVLGACGQLSLAHRGPDAPSSREPAKG